MAMVYYAQGMHAAVCNMCESYMQHAVGRALAWDARSRGFESHLRQLIFP